jgi:sugar/nucleoside kinase (ribokinase family)
LIIKKGEHGALLFTENSVFCTPAYLMESISDPTGAGDTFAGGFIGYLAKKGKVTEENLRKAVVYGSIMATFTVEDFSLNRLANIKNSDIEKRYKEFCCLTGF